MEYMVIHENEPHEDVVRMITAREREDHAFAEAEEQVETLYCELGARVMYGRSCAGEATVSPFVPYTQSAAMREFSNRPA